MILFNNGTKTFYLESENTSYIMQVLENNTLAHVYYGKKIAQDDMSYYAFYENRSFSAPVYFKRGVRSMETIPQEMPTAGRGDFRTPAVVVLGADGRRVNDLKYVSHKLLSGKPSFPDMPELNVGTENCETLEITLRDEVSGFDAVLYYTVFANSDVISRRTVVKNISANDIKVDAVASLSVDFDVSNFEMISLKGAHNRERHVERYPLHQGVTSIESRRGASSHQLNPFAAFVSPNTDEFSGDAYGVTLVYSADFKISAEVEPFGAARITAGINPEAFSWTLAAGESFVSPEALITYSANGLNGMSQSFHKVSREHLGKLADKSISHPIIINSWEAMYFDMNEEKIRSFVSECKGLGIDTFVLDDGWFGHRDNDTTSLGDWFVDKRKFPEGLNGVIDACRENGMKFGIWFEPEMISKESELYKAHPDWCIHVDGRNPVEARQQLVLDFARDEVVDTVYDMVSAILNEYDISYVKWDMNRHITDNGSNSLPEHRQGEHAHRYILGVYRLMDRIVNAFPNVFFEGCSGGGGRFDYGMLYYMPQIWTSDDSDAHERLKIQYGTSFAYPTSSMVAHVSACPNHQTGRTTPFKTRGEVAQMCNYGYELNIGSLSDEERSQITEQIAKHREMEDLVRNGTFYRIKSPFDTAGCAWSIVSEDKSRAYAMIMYKTAFPNALSDYLKLCGLDENRKYTVKQLGITLSGSTLMNAGLPILQHWGDYDAYAFDLIAE